MQIFGVAKLLRGLGFHPFPDPGTLRVPELLRYWEPFDLPFCMKSFRCDVNACARTEDAEGEVLT